jgi:hypothetical protein
MAALALASPAAAQAPTLSYPASRSLPDIAAWLQRDTPLLPSQVVDVAPSAITAVVSVTPMGETRGFLATINSEALNPDIESHDGVASWSIPVEVDCERRSVRLGVMTGYRNRDLRTEPKVLRPADSAFVNPTPSAPLGAVVRALCDRDFRRPLTGAARVARAPPAPKPASPPLTVVSPSAAAPRVKTAAPRPPPRPGPVNPSIQVQVGASTSLPDAKGLMARFRRKFATDLAGLSGDVATAEVDGKTVYRALVTGFRSAAEANALCGRLKTGGQACFVRR